MTVSSRWENGSGFSWLGTPRGPRTQPVPWDGDGALLSSGRDALRLVLDAGVTRHNWSRLWVPEYFCQKVIAGIRRPDLELVPYFDHPLLATPRPPAACPGDAVLVVNYFGLRDGFPACEMDGVDVIEDHTHDPTSQWARLSRADYCVASLRKMMPLSDGGAAWSPCGHALPPVPALTSQRRRAAALALSAMLLKSMYLDGLPVERGSYRELAHRGERGLARPGVCAISDVSRAVVDSFDFARWREARHRNVDALRDALDGVRWMEVLGHSRPAQTVPFSAVLLVDDPARREWLRQEFLRRSVFPAVLWPLERAELPVSDQVLDVSRRLLSVHGDGRYTVDDMLSIAGIVRSLA